MSAHGAVLLVGCDDVGRRAHDGSAHVTDEATATGEVLFLGDDAVALGAVAGDVKACVAFHGLNLACGLIVAGDDADVRPGEGDDVATARPRLRPAGDAGENLPRAFHVAILA